MSVLSLDPGVMTGWAIWSDQGHLLRWGNLGLAEKMQLLANRKDSTIVYEDYRLRYGRQPAADSHHTAAQIIGAVKLLYWQGHIAAEERQEVEVLTVESLHLQLEQPKNHKTGHYVDAVLHGAYWFRRVGITPDISALLIRTEP